MCEVGLCFEEVELKGDKYYDIIYCFLENLKYRQEEMKYKSKLSGILK